MTGAPSSSFTLLGSTTGWRFVERDGDAEEGTAAKAAFKSPDWHDQRRALPFVFLHGGRPYFASSSTFRLTLPPPALSLRSQLLKPFLLTVTV
jgi:hypothetical protein